jgi:hypothetical protein
MTEWAPAYDAAIGGTGVAVRAEAAATDAVFRPADRRRAFFVWLSALCLLLAGTVFFLRGRVRTSPG